MKWPLIIPLAFIASLVMFGCSGGEEDSTYVSPEGETAIEGEDVVQEGVEQIGTETQDPL